ncbi:hypothetical protein ACOQFL_20315 [Actinopolyspora sp. H202]|uniref:hypothetical protein n=1 Tax=Actinopolyspora sp. H202 TaxID=1500456 RepID=UPI003EE4BDAB
MREKSFLGAALLTGMLILAASMLLGGAPSSVLCTLLLPLIPLGALTIGALALVFARHNSGAAEHGVTLPESTPRAMSTAVQCRESLILLQQGFTEEPGKFEHHSWSGC